MRIANIKELADIIKVKPKTLYQWAELGQIPCVKMNGALRFDLDDIESWLQGCKKERSDFTVKRPDIGYNNITQARGPKKGGLK